MRLIYSKFEFDKIDKIQSTKLESYNLEPTDEKQSEPSRTKLKIFNQEKDFKKEHDSSLIYPKQLRLALEMLDYVEDNIEQIRILVRSMPELIQKSPQESKVLSTQIITKFVKISNNFNLECLTSEFIFNSIFKTLVYQNPPALLTISTFLCKSDISLPKNLSICQFIETSGKMLRNAQFDTIEIQQNDHVDGKILKISKKLKNQKIVQTCNNFANVGINILPNLVTIYKLAKETLLKAAVLRAISTTVENLENQTTFTNILKRNLVDFTLQVFNEKEDIVLEQGLKLLYVMINDKIIENKVVSSNDLVQIKDRMENILKFK